MLVNLLVDSKKYKKFIVLTAAFLFIVHCSFLVNECVAQEAGAGLGTTVTISVRNVPIKDVLVEFSRQTNWYVLFDAAIEKEQVSGSFSQEPLDSFLNKILKGKNLIVLYDAKQKIVEIQSFGDKRPRTFLISKGQLRESPLSTDEQAFFVSHVNALSQLEKFKGELSSSEPLTGAQLGAIATLQQQQKKVHEEYLNNPESIEPFTGAKLGAIAELQEQQRRVHEEYLNNPESIEPFTGAKLGAIAELQEQQRRVHEEYLNNPESIDPLTGMTLGAIAARQNQQKKIHDTHRTTPNPVRP